MANVQDYELLLRVRADLNQALRGLDSVRGRLDNVGAEAERTSRRTSAAVEGINGKLESVKRVLAGIAIAEGFRAILAAVTESEDALAQLDARLRSTRGAAGLSREGLVAMAGALQQVTTYGDEAIMGVESLLLTFTRIRGPEFQSALATVLDMSTALGQDLKASAIQVGKALNDPIKGVSALAEVGVSFTASQKEVITQLVQTGRVAEAQQLILAELQTEFGGAAQAAANTFGGALKQAQEAAGDLLEGDGGGLKGTTEAVRELTKTLQDPDVKEGFASMVTGLVNVAGAAANAIAKVAGFAKTVGEEIAKAQGYVDRGNLGDVDARIGEIQLRLNKLNEYAAKGIDFRPGLADSEDPAAARARNKANGIKGWWSYSVAQEIASLKAEQEQLVKVHQELSGQLPGPKSPAGKAAGGGVETITVYAPKDGATGRSKASTAPTAQYVAAADALRQRLIDLQAALDPTAAAWAAYNKAVDEANKQAALAKQAPGANVAAIDGERNAIVQLAAAQRDAAIGAQAKADRKAYQDLLDTIGTPARTQLDDALAELAKFKAMLDDGKISAEQFEEARRRIGGTISTAPPPSFAGVDAVVGGPIGELAKTGEAADQLEQWYQQQQDMLVQARQQQLITNAQFDAQEEALKKQHEEAMHGIDLARAQSSLAVAQQGFGQLAETMKAAYGEQSKQYRIAFALQKAAAIAQAILAVQTSIAESSKIGYPWNIIAIAGAVAQGAATLATIRSTQAGFAEGGMTPPGGKYQVAGVVHAGEGVLSQEDIASLGGPSAFYALRAAIKNGSLGLPGYADGGFVQAMTSTADFPRMPTMPAIPTTPAGGQGQGGARIRIVNTPSEDLMRDWANSSENEQVILNVIGRNKTAVRTLVS